MRKNLGDKGKEITPENRDQILSTYLNFEENEICKIFENEYFGYTKVQVEQPLVEDGQVKKDRSGKPKPDSKLRDHERIPLKDSIDEYYETEVKPHLPDSWMDRSKDKVGYEISFVKEFYKFEKLKNTNEIKNELKLIEEEIFSLKI
jgi:type I restriction enzyme M protein